MHLPSVQLFLEVADAGSLSKVAARRQTVQSHVSRQIGDFEASMGGALFRRTGRGVTLTEFGERAAVRLRAWLQDTERLGDELRAASGRVWGEVRLGIIPSAAHPLVTSLFHKLQREHPGIRLNITEAQGTELNALLDSGAVDAAVLFRFNRPTSGDERLLSVAHTYLVSGPDDALTRDPTVSFQRLAGVRLVLPRRPSHWRNALDEAARSLGFELHAVIDADSLTVQKEIVASTPGMYTVLGPYSMAAELQAGRLRASQLVKPDLTRHVTLALPKHGNRSAATREVAAAIESLMASWDYRLTPGLPEVARRPASS